MNGAQQCVCCGHGIVVESARIGVELRFVLGQVVLGHRISAHVFGACGIDAFGIFLCHFDKRVVLDAVVRDKDGFHLFLAHRGNNLGGFGMIAAENYSVRFAAFDFLDHSGVIYSAGCNAFVQRQFGAAVGFDEAFGKFGQSLAVVALVMQHGDFLYFEHVQREIDFQARLGIIRSDGPEKVRVITTLRQGRIGRGRRHDNLFGAFIDTQGSFGCTTADMTEHDCHIFAHQLGSGTGGHFGLADIVFDDQFDLFTQDAAFGIDIGHNQLCGID